MVLANVHSRWHVDQVGGMEASMMAEVVLAG